MTILGRSFIVNGTEKQKHLTLQIYQTIFTMFLVDFEILHLYRQKRPIKDQFIGTAIFLFLNILNNVTRTPAIMVVSNIICILSIMVSLK